MIEIGTEIQRREYDNHGGYRNVSYIWNGGYGGGVKKVYWGGRDRSFSGPTEAVKIGYVEMGGMSEEHFLSL